MVPSPLNMGEAGEDRARKSGTPSELTNYMNAITLQIEVTKFMYSCVAEGAQQKAKVKKKRLGTLFDNAATKCTIVAEVSCVLVGTHNNEASCVCACVTYTVAVH